MTYDNAICLGETINIDIDEKPGLTYVWTMSNGDIIATTADLTLRQIVHFLQLRY